MNKITLALLLLLTTTITLAQKKEKIKGSKIVTTEQREIGYFNSLEVEDNLEVFIERGTKPGITIEADDNLHDIIITDLEGDVLRLYTSNNIIKNKKLTVRVSYAKNPDLIISRNKSILNAIDRMQSDNIVIKTFDNSRFLLNVDANNFLLQADDNSKVELNLKSEKAKIELSKNASLKSLITSNELGCDLYQKANANIEGDVENAVIRLDNRSDLTAKKLTVKKIDLTTESFSSCSLNAQDSIIINANENSEIQLYGDPKIEIKQFSDEAKLLKKMMK